MTAPIVGSWRATVTIPGGPPPFVNLVSFTSDGVVLNAFPTPSPAQPGSSHKLEFFTTAVGSWNDVGSGNVAMAFETLGVDENGTPIGSHVVRATVEVASNGSGWHGPFTLTVLDTAGNQVMTVSGTVTGARIGAS